MIFHGDSIPVVLDYGDESIYNIDTVSQTSVCVALNCVIHHLQDLFEIFAEYFKRGFDPTYTISYSK